MCEVVCEPDKDRFIELARDVSPDVRIPVEFELTGIDPFDAYRSVRTDGPSVFLETTGGQSGWGYFAVDPIELLTAREPATSLDCGASPSLAALAARLEGERLVRGDCTVPYPCGLFGWLSYDLVRELEALPGMTTDDRRLPQLEFGLFDRVVAWEEPREAGAPLHVVACPRVGADPTTAFERGRRRATALIERMGTGPPTVHSSSRAPTATFASDTGRAEYIEHVEQIKRYIRAGDTFQVNVSHRLSAPATIPPVAVYTALRRVNPAPYSGLMELPSVDLVSASPELLLSIKEDTLVTEPIAGTRPRGSTVQEDQRLERELRSDAKERAEHAMLVDLERNDLGKVAQYGSVAVDEYRRIDRYSEVMHLVSRVSATLRPTVSLAGVCTADPLTPATSTPADRLCAAIAALFPGGTITGAPKPRTMEIIDELEGTRRGPYTGSMAIIGFDQRAVLNIVIRTLVRHDGAYHLRVGAGIVHDSIPDREYDETMAKARALLNAVDDALADESTLEVVE